MQNESLNMQNGFSNLTLLHTEDIPLQKNNPPLHLFSNGPPILDMNGGSISPTNSGPNISLNSPSSENLTSTNFENKWGSFQGWAILSVSVSLTDTLASDTKYRYR